MAFEFLASPGGVAERSESFKIMIAGGNHSKIEKLAFFQSALRNRLKKSLMRGGDRLVQECSWMNGICFNFHHSTYCYGDFKLSPPLISHNENIGSEVPLFCCDSFPPGEAKGKKPQAIHNQRITLSRELAGRLLGDPYSWRCKTMGTHHSNLRHSLSQPVRAASSLREGAKGASHQGTTGG